MLRYYKRMKDSDEWVEIDHEAALNTLLGTWKDTDLTRDMLTIPNMIECMCSWVQVKDPDSTLMPMPGLFNLYPDGAEYDEETWMRIN